MGIWRRHVGEDGIERQQATLHQQGDVRQLDRDELRASFVDGRAGVRSDEEGPVEEVALHLGGEVRVRPLAMQMNDLDVLQFRGLAAQGVEERGRRGGGALDVDLLTGFDPRDRLIGADDTHPSNLCSPHRGARAERPHFKPAATTCQLR